MTEDTRAKEIFSTWLDKMERKANNETNPLIKDLLWKQIADYKKYFDTLTEQKK